MHTLEPMTLDGHIEGAINFRDLGGVPAGAKVVRTGLIFRSAMTHHITPAGLAALANTYSIRTVVDFRSDEELTVDGLADWSVAGITHRHYPIDTGAILGPEERAERLRAIMSGDLPWADLYADIARHGQAGLAQFFTTLADDSSFSVVFHCAGGRDRTGVGAALLLSALGVEPALVAADYARTGELLRPHTDRLLRFANDAAIPREQIVDAVMNTRPEVMLAFLAYLEEAYGSVRDYLASIGVEDAAIEAIRDRVLEPASA